MEELKVELELLRDQLNKAVAKGNKSYALELSQKIDIIMNKIILHKDKKNENLF